MGYEMPLHGLDGDGEKVPPTAEEDRRSAAREAASASFQDAKAEADQMSEDWGQDIGRPGALKVDPEPESPFNQFQTARAVAAKFAATLLAETSKPGVMTGRAPVSAEQIILLASFIVGSPDEDFPLRMLDGPTSADAMNSYTSAFEQKVAARQRGFNAAFGEAFAKLLQKATESNATMVAPADLRVGDQVAIDGDTITVDPVYSAENDTWTITVDCPANGTFDYPIGGGQKQPVFNREPEAGEDSVPQA